MGTVQHQARRTNRSVIVGMIAAAVCASLVVPRAAHAGFYAVSNSCGNAYHAWAPATSDSNVVAVYPDCSGVSSPRHGPDFMIRPTGHPATAPNNSFGQWILSAPPGTRIIGGNLAGEFLSSGGGWIANLWGNGPNDPLAGCSDIHTPCVQSFADPHGFSGTSATQIWLQIHCYNANGCAAASSAFPGSPGAFVALSATNVVLSDDVGPWATITGGALAGGGWLRGSQSLTFDSGDTGSGVRTIQLFPYAGVGAAQTYTAGCDASYPTPCPTHAFTGWSIGFDTSSVGDGAHTGILRVIDYSGNATDAPFRYYTDNTSPVSTSGSVSVQGGDSWRPRNTFAVSITRPLEGSSQSPITDVLYRQCPDTTDSLHCQAPWTGPVKLDSGKSTAVLAGLQAPSEGAWRLEVAFADQAGNRDLTRPNTAAQLRFDDRPPLIEQLGTASGDQGHLLAQASDDLSGIADGQIDLATHGSDRWRSMRTEVSGNLLGTEVDDTQWGRGFKGYLDERVIVRDRAGNATEAEVPNAVKIPFRLPTRLRAGFAVRRTVRHHGRRRHVTRLVAARRVRLDHHTTISGLLRTPDGQPLGNARVLVLSRPDRSGASDTVVGAVNTGKTGRFHYQTIARTNRVITIMYPGNTIRQPALKQLRLEVPASSTLHASPKHLLNGGTVTLHGRLRGGHVPAKGKLLLFQAIAPNGQWRTFDQVRSGPTGRWHYRYQFTETRGLQHYKLRFLIPSEELYPFASGVTRTVRVTVRGQ